MEGVATELPQSTAKAEKRESLAFRALVLFSLVYYARPEDIISPLRLIPLSKILGAICVIGLIAGLSGRRRMKIPLALKFLLLLFAQMILSIPFAYWRGGAFAMVFQYFAKGVIVAFLISLLVDTLPQLRKLLFVQTAAVSFMTFASLAAHHMVADRLAGATGGIFENSNDLAINLAVNLPFCFAFFIRARGGLRKMAWLAAVMAMLLAILLTYSRSGFLALLLGGMVLLWEFGVKGRRFYLLALAAFLVIMMFAFAPHNYSIRLESIFLGHIPGAIDRGSKEARTELLETSVHLMMQHPLFGIGPGNFPTFSGGGWKVAHNTYAQMGAEVGIPALILFLLVLGAGLNNLFVAQKSALYKSSLEFRIFIGGLIASMAAYMLGAFFADTAYNLFPYFLVAYTCAARRIAELEAAKPAASGAEKPSQAVVVKRPYADHVTTSSRSY